MKKTIVVLALCLAALSGCDRGKKPAVMLVIIDTLPTTHSSAYGYERATTAQIERLAKDGILYQHAISAAPWTLPSIASILTGAYPSRHMAGYHLDPPTQEDRRLAKLDDAAVPVTMAEMFKSHGYKTAGFFNNPFVNPGYGLTRGFDTYDYVEGDNLTIRNAADTTSAVIKWLDDNGKKPFFIVVHYFDPHLAYNPPIDFAAPYLPPNTPMSKIPFNPDLYAIRSGALQVSPEDRELAKDLYDGELASVDAEMARLMKYLRDNGLYERMMVVITSDHGEEFWEHGGYEHGHSLHREVIEVPLVIKYPGLDQAGKTVKEYVSLLDIMPTMAEFLGWPLPAEMDGVSLYPRGGRLEPEPHVVVTENMHYGPQLQSFISDCFKLIVNTETGALVVYDLCHDPDETKDVFGEVKLPPKVKAQVEHIAANLDNLIKKGTAEASQLDPETIRKLRALGYIGGSAKPVPAAGSTAPAATPAPAPTPATGGTAPAAGATAPAPALVPAPTPAPATGTTSKEAKP